MTVPLRPLTIATIIVNYKPEANDIHADASPAATLCVARSPVLRARACVLWCVDCVPTAVRGACSPLQRILPECAVLRTIHYLPATSTAPPHAAKFACCMRGARARPRPLSI